MASNPIDPYPLVESVSFRWGVLENLDYHQERYERSLYVLAKTRGIAPRPVSIGPILAEGYSRWEEEVQPDLTLARRPGQVKGRILYGLSLGPVDFALYRPPVYSCFAVVSALGLSYPYKWGDRRELERWGGTLGSGVYPLFEVGGQITDDLAANVVLKREGRWVTPSSPLLPGTQRARLIDRGVLFPVEIRPAEVLEAGEVFLINALNRLGEWKLPLANLTGVAGSA